MSNDALAFLSATELLDRYRTRELSPVEVTRAVLERIDRLNPRLNAYLCVDHDGALAAAAVAEKRWQSGDAPLLCGVPVSIKDLIYTSWLPTTHGSLLFKDRLHPTNAPVVERLLDAGAVVLGKTNTPEFGLIDMTRNHLGDECVCPWDLERTAGGSSGGAGAAVAAGLGPLAIGTDGAGSIRIPSFINGCFGLKPTFGRVPHDGWKGAPRLSHQGPMTRTVRDAALVMQATAGYDPADALSLRQPPPDFLAGLEPRSLAGTKVAISLDFGYIAADAEIQQAVRDAVDLLRSLGCETVEADPPRQAGGSTQLAFAAGNEYAYAKEICPDVDDRFDELTNYGRATLTAGQTALAWQQQQAARKQDAWAAAIHDWFEDVDYLVAPVMGQMAVRVDEPRRLKEGEPWPGMFLPPFNASGNPAASVPFGFHSSGLPLAVQIVGRHGDDAGVLRLSAMIEAERPWAEAWPPIAKEGAAVA